MKKDHVALQRRPFLTPLWLAAWGAFAAFVIVGFASWLWGGADSTTFIIVRHAEKVPGALLNPPLSAEGEARAKVLVRMLGENSEPGRITAIYVTAALRNQMTAAPLAARLGLSPIVASGTPHDLARRALREQDGGRVLIVGHADTLPTLVSDLSGVKNIPAVGAEEYGTMYIVTVPRIGHANLLRIEY